MSELPDLEEEEIRDSFGPISESVAEELSRRQAEALDDARVRNAIKGFAQRLRIDNANR